MRPPTIIAALAIILASTAPSPAQPNVQGAVELSNGTRVPQNPSLPKLNLTNMQREQIRKAVLTEHNEVEFRLKAAQPAARLDGILEDEIDSVPARDAFWHQVRKKLGKLRRLSQSDN